MASEQRPRAMRIGTEPRSCGGPRGTRVSQTCPLHHFPKGERFVARSTGGKLADKRQKQASRWVIVAKTCRSPAVSAFQPGVSVAVLGTASVSQTSAPLHLCSPPQQAPPRSPQRVHRCLSSSYSCFSVLPSSNQQFPTSLFATVAAPVPTQVLFVPLHEDPWPCSVIQQLHPQILT